MALLYISTLLHVKPNERVQCLDYFQYETNKWYVKETSNITMAARNVSI